MKTRQQTAFTLIELLVVVTIIGILAAIAIPQFQEYRVRSYDSQAVNDLKNVSTSQEEYFIENDTYIACTDGANCESALNGFERSSNVRLIVNISGAGDSYTTYACHPDGSKSYRFQSTNGSMQSHTLINRDCSTWDITGLTYS